MRDPGLQAQVVKADAIRTLPPSAGDVVGVFTANTNGSKTDVWQQRSVQQKVTVNADGSVDVVRTVTVRNAAPAYNPPPNDPATGFSAPPNDPGTGYLTRVAAPRITDYFTGSAKIRSVTVNGAKARYLRFPERGLRVVSVNPIRLNPGQSAVVVIRYRLPTGTASGGVLPIAVAAQPTYLPVPFSLSVSAGGGCTGAGQGWSTVRGTARLTQTMAPLQTTVRCGSS
jgi:hypothetical protein